MKKALFLLIPLLFIACEKNVNITKENTTEEDMKLPDDLPEGMIPVSDNSWYNGDIFSNPVNDVEEIIDYFTRNSARSERYTNTTGLIGKFKEEYNNEFFEFQFYKGGIFIYLHTYHPYISGTVIESSEPVTEKKYFYYKAFLENTDNLIYIDLKQYPIENNNNYSMVKFGVYPEGMLIESRFF